MPAEKAISGNASVNTNSSEGDKKLKPCCACPDTRKRRDTCILEKGEDHCRQLIEEHKECLRQAGFKV